MSAELFAVGVGIAVLVAFARWRSAVFLIVVFGSLQDPIRKLTPDTPAIMAISSIPIWAAACLAAFKRERSWRDFRRTWPRLATLIKVFLLSLLPATFVVFQYGLVAWRMAVIGLFGYLVPIASILVGFTYVTERFDIRRVLAFYCLFAAAMMSGSFMEYLGTAPSWAALGTAALNVRWIRYLGSEQVDLVSGFYRSPDVMGWHAATLTMFALTLHLDPRRRNRWIWPLLATVGALALLVCGRRKMMAMPVLWCAFVVLSLFRTARASRVVTIVFVVAAIAGAVLFAASEMSVTETYYVYAATTPMEASERLVQDTWGAVANTFMASGPLGRGIGSASQGTQHIGFEEARGWQESGLSKLAVELGALGLLCGMALMVTIARSCIASIRSFENAPGPMTIHVGLFGFLVANGVAFLISHQVYGDSLVMVMTSFVIGVVLSSRRPAAVAAATNRVPPRGALAVAAR